MEKKRKNIKRKEEEKLHLLGGRWQTTGTTKKKPKHLIKNSAVFFNFLGAFKCKFKK